MTMTMNSMGQVGQQYRFNSFNSMTPFNSFNSQHMNWAPEPISCSKVTDKLVNELQIFMHKSAMQMHNREAHRAEVKPHQCQQCLKSFSSNHQLVQHIRVHTGEKPYKCSYCDRRFKQLSHVQQHTRLHTGERPYKCHMPDCGRAFIQLSNLQQHLRNHDAQLERMKNRPFHCNICGKGFATESSLRTHTSKVPHVALVEGPNAANCPQCSRHFLSTEQLMEHMKFTHRDPNASGVPAKRRTASHSCPVCGKHYVNEGSLRKHLACHPETSQFTSSLRMWPCSVCHAVFTHESGLLNHMEHMRMDPKHQFAAQYVLSRAAAERRERESLLGLAQVGLQGSQVGNHMGMGMMGMGMGSMGMGMHHQMQMQHQGHHQSLPGQMPMATSPSTQSDASSRMSTPAEKMDPLGRMPSPSEALRSISSHHDVMNMRPHGSDNMRAMISQSQAELVKSTLTSQAETIRSVMASQAEVIRSLTSNPQQAQQSHQQQTQPQPQQQQPQQNPQQPQQQQQQPQQPQAQPQQQHHQPPEPMASPQPDLRDMRCPNNMESALRNQAEAALRLANHDIRQQQPDLGEAIRLQEMRMEQALRLHSDPRALPTSLPGPLGFSLTQAQQQAQQQSA